jgi:hypothetical protein
MPQFPAHPFVNQFPALGPDDPIDPAKLAALAGQVAVSADGRIYSDLSVVKNWKYTQPSVPSPMRQRTLIRDPVSRRWLQFGEAGGELALIWTVSGLVWTGPIFPAGSPVLNQAFSAFANNAGVILAGSGASSNTTGKLRESTNGGDSWVTRNIGASDQLFARALVYSETLNLWLCTVGGLSGGAGAGIYSSVDRVTWTLRSTGVYSDYVIKDTASPIILMTTHNHASPSAGVFRSTDGINWAAEAVPWSEISPAKGTWSEEHGAFFIGTASGLWRSATGVAGSWTKVNNDNYSASSSIGALGRILVRGDGKASIDGGVNWVSVLELANNDLHVTAVPGFGVGVVRGTTRDIYISHQIGF